ncbi:MAG: hypothetical protein KDJ37_07445 [Hyphomicrobiaceae bacterium]|nr:hypothetical protein [Hyphomicrobiaceae bacterium]
MFRRGGGPSALRHCKFLPAGQTWVFSPAMEWMRRRRQRRTVAGLALAAAILHVALLSLHAVAMAGSAMAGGADAARGSSAWIICGPLRLATSRAANQNTGQLASPELDTNTGGTIEGGVSCPFCTIAGGAPALLIPDVPAMPAYIALDQPLFWTVAAITIEQRHAFGDKRSRAPPARA